MSWSLKIRGALSLVLCLCFCGCIERERVNADCEWTDAAFAMDLSRPDHQSHLNDDVQLAEELGIRHGDAFRSSDGIVEARRRREQCTTALFGRIVSLHGVTQADVDRARGSRDLRVDAVTVLLPMALLFVFVTNQALSRIADRFLPEEVWPAIVAALLASVVISGVGLAVGNMWSWIVESIRLGNGHLSYRAFYQPGVRHPLSTFLAGVVTFWLVGLFRYRLSVENSRPGSSSEPDSRVPRGLQLR